MDCGKLKYTIAFFDPMADNQIDFSKLQSSRLGHDQER